MSRPGPTYTLTSGEVLTIREAAARLDCKVQTIHHRLQAGWSIGRTLTTLGRLR